MKLTVTIDAPQSALLAAVSQIPPHFFTAPAGSPVRQLALGLIEAYKNAVDERENTMTQKACDRCHKVITPGTALNPRYEIRVGRVQDVQQGCGTATDIIHEKDLCAPCWNTVSIVLEERLGQ